MAFTTRKSLLAKVRSGDEVSWREFYETYKPLILLCGGDLRLTADEKEELVSKVMCEIFRKDIVGKYDPEKVPDDVVFKYDPARGRFRHFLRKIIRNQALGIIRKRPRHVSLDVPDAPDPVAEDRWESDWDREWRRHLCNMALIELRNHVDAKTYSAFELYAIQGRDPREVADFLGLSVASVYTGKSRCIEFIKKIIKDLEEQ